MTISCPCGSFIFPKETTLKINDSVSTTFLHTNIDILLSAGQKFKTITSELTVNNPQSYLINFGSPIVLENQIKITIKSYVLDKILAIAFVGNVGETYSLQNIKIYGDSLVLSPVLSNDRIILEIDSVCQEINETCCDKLPSSLSVSCILDPCEICIPVNDPSTTLPPSTTTTTTTTTLNPNQLAPPNISVSSNTNACIFNNGFIDSLRLMVEAGYNWPNPTEGFYPVYLDLEFAYSQDFRTIFYENEFIPITSLSDMPPNPYDMCPQYSFGAGYYQLRMKARLFPGYYYLNLSDSIYSYTDTYYLG